MVFLIIFSSPNPTKEIASQGKVTDVQLSTSVALPVGVLNNICGNKYNYQLAVVAEIVSQLLLNHACNISLDQEFETVWFCNFFPIFESGILKNKTGLG